VVGAHSNQAGASRRCGGRGGRGGSGGDGRGRDRGGRVAELGLAFLAAALLAQTLGLGERAKGRRFVVCDVR